MGKVEIMFNAELSSGAISTSLYEVSFVEYDSRRGIILVNLEGGRTVVYGFRHVICIDADPDVEVLRTISGEGDVIYGK